MKWNQLWFSIFILLVTQAVYATSVYRWVDEDGHVHFSGRPTNKNAEEITIKDHTSEPGENSSEMSTEERVENQKRFLNALDEENRSIKEEKIKKQEKEERDIRRCNAARDQLKRAEGASALYDLDEKGNRVLLNKEQYEQAMVQARARVEKWCN